MARSFVAPSLNPDAIVPTPYDPEEFAALYHVDKQGAIALLAAMTKPQCVRRALAYCVWLGYHGLEIDLATVLAAWGVMRGELLSAHCADSSDTTRITGRTNYAIKNPFILAVFLHLPVSGLVHYTYHLARDSPPPRQPDRFAQTEFR